MGDPFKSGKFPGQGIIVGQVTESSALIRTLLTSSDPLDELGDLPGVTGEDLTFAFYESRGKQLRRINRSRTNHILLPAPYQTAL